MKTFILLGATLAFSAFGCATTQTAPASAPAATGACPGGTMSGTWSGTGTDSTGHWTFAGTLRQEGTKVSGSFDWNNLDNGSSAKDNVEGTVNCDSRAFTIQTVSLERQAGNVAATTYTGTLSPDFASMSGTWTVGGGGTFTAAKK